MTTTAMGSPFIGSSQIGNMSLGDTIPRHKPGSIAVGVDPYFGAGEFIYLQADSDNDYGSIYIWDANFLSSKNPITANTGRSLAFGCLRKIISGTWNWHPMTGIWPSTSVSQPAVGATIGFSAGTPGQLGASSAGRQILNAVIADNAASRIKFSKTVNCELGSNVWRTSDTSGLYQNLSLAGVGIAGSANVVEIIDNNRFTLDSNSIITGSGLVTVFSFGSTLFIEINRPMAQGQIT